MSMEIEINWKKLQLCKCVEIMLIECGFTDHLTIRKLNCETITLLESYLEKNRHILEKLPKCHGSNYRKQHSFSFLPAHRLIILDLPETLSDSIAKPDLFPADHPAFSYILKEMISSALKNFNRPQTGRRYSKGLLDFSMYICMSGGRATYEILSENLPMPKASTINRHIQQNKFQIVEGQLRCKELKDHLEKIGAPKTAFISEDGSGIIKKIVFDCKTNQLVGIVLPLDPTNGSPKLFQYMATSEEEIRRCMELPESSLIYIITAQPLKEHVPPFILQLYGTDNKFKSVDVSKRWNFIISELKRYGINVLGFSSDGDQRLLACMRSKVQFNLHELSEKCLENYYNNANGFVYIQDTIHIATKLRNRLLKPSILLPMGNYQVSIAHIKMLLSSVSKEQHGLVKSDICPEDRQNFQSFEKITKERVIRSLEQSIFGSQATVAYLKICHKIVSSFLDTQLQPTERIYCIWYSIYLLRAWRVWLQQSKYKLKDHFISTNSYACIELNGHGLIYVMQLLKHNGQANWFLPHLMSSQPCEHQFRKMRSLAPSLYTKINFNLFEVLHLVARIELMNNIIYSQMNIAPANSEPGSSSSDVCPPRICFPRVETKSDKSNEIVPNIVLPTNEEIIRILQQARSDALMDASKLGMKIDVPDVNKCALLESKQLMELEQEFDEDNLELEDLLEDDGWFFDGSIEEVQAREEGNRSLYSKCIDILSEDGSIKTMLKSTFIWILSEFKQRLSSDRRIRVQQNQEEKTKRRRMNSPSGSITTAGENEIRLIKSNEIELGEWCIFKQSNLSVEHLSESNILQNCVFGCIVGFKSSKKYSSDFAPTTNNAQYGCIQALATWYVSDKNGYLQQSENKNHYFLNVADYIATFKNLSEHAVTVEFNATKCLSIAKCLTSIRNLLYKYASK